MTEKKPGYWRRLLAALVGRSVTGAPGEGAGPDESAAEAKARAATLEMDVQERDERIERMQSEYAALQAEKERLAEEAGSQEIEALFKKIAGTLSNLSALAQFAEGDTEVEAKDLAQLALDLERQLAAAGLEPIGRAGEEATFDVALHQRMSGGSVREGTPVTVNLPGYRTSQRVLLKAMVSAGEQKNGESRG